MISIDENILSQLLKVDTNLHGSELIAQILRNTAKALDIPYILVGVPANDNQKSIQTTHLFAKGNFIDNFSYELENTPCANVMDLEKVCLYPTEVTRLFPLDQILTDMNIDAYAGTPIFNEDQELKGLVVVLDEKKFENPSVIKFVLEIISSRIGVEISKQESEAQIRLINQSLEEIIEEKTKHLKESMQLNKELLATIYHDLTNPMTVVSMMSQRGVAKPEKAHESLKLIQKACSEGQNIINNVKLLVTSTDNKNLDFKKIKVRDCFEYTHFMFKHLLDNKNIHFEYKLHDENSYIKTEETIFKNSILNNIISNAIKFSKPGQKIFLKTFEENNHIHIEILDQGTGIPKEVIEALNSNETSHSLKGTNNEKGTGYGLLICQSYLKKLSGSMTIESSKINPEKIKQGSIITLRLPI